VPHTCHTPRHSTASHVTHGHSPTVYLVRCCRRSAARPSARTSKLVMRVRFPSSALIVPALLFVFVSAKSLPMPAAIFWSRSRVACRYI